MPVNNIAAFSVSLTGDPARAVRFYEDKIYIGDQLLTNTEQQKLLADYISAYQVARRRNYGWRFLSACHDYFNGQLHEIKDFSTTAEKMRYLFLHAAEKPESKTTEALRTAISFFFVGKPSVQSEQTVGQRAETPAKSVILKVLDDPKKTPSTVSKPSPQVASAIHSRCHDRYLRWMDEVFLTLWRMPAIQKVASVQYDARHLRYYLFFYNDSYAAIVKSNPGFFARFNPYDTTIDRETAEAEWGKKLYCFLVDFRRRIDSSRNLVKEINAAFNELIKQVHVDPPEVHVNHIRSAPFYEAVVELRHQVIAIHMEWRKTVEQESVNLESAGLSR